MFFASVAHCGELDQRILYFSNYSRTTPLRDWVPWRLADQNNSNNIDALLTVGMSWVNAKNTGLCGICIEK